MSPSSSASSSLSQILRRAVSVLWPRLKPDFSGSTLVTYVFRDRVLVRWINESFAG